MRCLQINLAILLGSDYTEGIHGIGIVNAYEIVTTFPGRDGLRGFQKWLDTPDVQGLKMAHGEQQSERILEFKRKHKAVKKNWEIPPGFPSQVVVRYRLFWYVRIKWLERAFVLTVSRQLYPTGSYRRLC